MTRDEFMRDYWRYFLILERQFSETMGYVELAQDNFDTYSLEYVTQLQSIGSEIDVFMKTLCGFEQSDIKSITDYCKGTIAKYPDIINQKVKIKMLEEPIVPFENWDVKCAKQSLGWWTAYDDVKHGRLMNLKKANLKNVLYALAALFVIETYFLKEIADEENAWDIPDEGSSLFVLLDWETNFRPLNQLVAHVVGKETATIGVSGFNTEIDGGDGV